MLYATILVVFQNWTKDGVLPVVECQPRDREVVGSIPGQVTTWFLSSDYYYYYDTILSR
jgi:hypothetical protein